MVLHGALFLFSLCGLWSASLSAEEGVAASSAAVVSSTETAPGEPAYVYKGDRMRDPFIPLAGGTLMASELSTRTDFSPFNPVNAELKGILKTPTGRWALLRTSEGGTYVVQNGRIYDPKRKPISGFQGIVKEKSVVILAPGNQEVELKLKSEEDAAKKN